MVAVWCESKVDYKTQAEPRDPVVLFDLDSLSINSTRFLAELNKSFEELEWDNYDVRREQLALLTSVLGAHGRYTDLFRSYYSGKIELQSLLSLVPHQSEETRAKLDRISPYRRRTTSKFSLKRSREQWLVDRQTNSAPAQKVDPKDYRSVQREFKETSVHVVEHPEFVKLLQAVGGLVKQADDAVYAMTITCWQTGIVATPERSGSNSPEGIHQDGADYIVSALVTACNNIEGGTSRVFGPDKKTEHLHVTLKPGQGIFQADAGSSLWHDVTPIRLTNPEEGPGIRNLFGFDVHVSERK